MNDTAYCGPAPLPATLLKSWNLDPFLVLALLVLCAAVALSKPTAERSRPALVGSVFTLAVAFISPLCALATALFSARVAHHILMIAVAAPLLALAAPRWRLPERVPLSVITVVHIIAVWLWHAPAPYAWAVSGTPSYWLMEITLLLTAFWFWSRVLSPSTRPFAALAALFAVVVQMGLLGAILTFARVPLYDLHAGVTAPFGLTQMEDQQLAGLFMWIPAAAPYLIAASIIVARLLPQGSAEPRGLDA